MKLVSISKRQYYNFKKNHPKAQIKLFGEIENNQELQIQNKINEKGINEFANRLLTHNNFNSTYSAQFISFLNTGLINSDKSTLNKLYNKLTILPVQTHINTTQPISLNHIISHYSNDFTSDFFSELLNFRLDGVGKGELFLGLLTNLVNGTKSDLKLENKEIEVKSVGGRLRDVYGYDSGNSTFEYINSEFKNNLQPDIYTELNLNIDSWNFIQKNVKFINEKLNKLIEQNYLSTDKLKTIFKIAFLKMYNQCPDSIVNRFVTNVFNGYLSENKLLEQFLIFQYEYYHFIKQFDYLLLIDNNNYLYINDKDDFKNKIQYINYSGVSFVHERNCAYSISLKK